MINSVLPFSKAVPVIIVGIAFFLSGCHPKLPSPKQVETTKSDLFVTAEDQWERGEWEKALKNYEAFAMEEPENRNAVFALQKIAEIHMKMNQEKEALIVFKKIERQYPDYTWIAHVKYQIASLLFTLGKYRQSVHKLMEWMGEYPQDPLQCDAITLLGDNYVELRDKIEAFTWWSEARKQCADHPDEMATLDSKLNQLISESPPPLLEPMARTAEGTLFAPIIYFRMATVYKDQGRLDLAKSAATALIQSTTNEHWISTGNQLLARIEGETSVKRSAIGCILPLSGELSIYGEEVLHGIELALGLEKNSGAGNGLELIIKDTRGKPEEALAGLQELVNDEKVIAIIGPLSSKTALEAARNAQRMYVPLITLTQKQEIVEEGDMIFRNLLTPRQEVEGLLYEISEKRGLKDFAILYPDNSYGHFCMNLFWNRIDEIGGSVTAVESYDPAHTDFAASIKKLAGLYYPRPESVTRNLDEMRTPQDEETTIYPEGVQPVMDFEAIFIPDSFERIAMIAPQLAYYDIIDIPLLGTRLWQSPRLTELAKDYVQGAIFTSGFFAAPDKPQGMAFLQQYEETFGREPGILAASGYDTMKLLKNLLSDQNVRTRADLKKALLKCEGLDGATGTMAFDAEGESLKKPFLLTISGRKTIPVP